MFHTEASLQGLSPLWNSPLFFDFGTSTHSSVNGGKWDTFYSCEVFLHSHVMWKHSGLEARHLLNTINTLMLLCIPKVGINIPGGELSKKRSAKSHSWWPWLGFPTSDFLSPFFRYFIPTIPHATDNVPNWMKLISKFRQLGYLSRS